MTTQLHLLLDILCLYVLDEEGRYICTKLLSDESSYQKHYLNHNPIKPFNCRVCIKNLTDLAGKEGLCLEDFLEEGKTQMAAIKIETIRKISEQEDCNLSADILNFLFDYYLLEIEAKKLGISHVQAALINPQIRSQQKYETYGFIHK